jgi:hypothetical protein
MDERNIPSLPEDALTLADQMIRRLDRESSKKLEQVTAEEKDSEEGAA